MARCKAVFIGRNTKVLQKSIHKETLKITHIILSHSGKCALLIVFKIKKNLKLKSINSEIVLGYVEE